MSTSATVHDISPELAQSVPVLLVDDNDGKRLALTAALAPLGFQIVEAGSGRDALRCLLAQDFAVILLDVRMPEMNGFETAAVIRQRRQSQLTPIIFITAYKNSELKTADRYVEGAVEFMLAPVRPEELRAKVAFFASLYLQAQALELRSRVVKSDGERWRLLVELVPIGVFQTDHDDRYVYTNQQWSKMTGVSAAEAAGHTWDIVGARSLGDPDFAADGSEVGRRYEVSSADGACRVVQVASRPIPDPTGRPVGSIGTLTDVTAATETAVALRMHATQLQ